MAITVTVESETGSKHGCFDKAESLLKIIKAEKVANSKLNAIENPTHAVKIPNDGYKVEEKRLHLNDHMDKIKKAVAEMSLNRPPKEVCTDISSWDPVQECVKVNAGHQLDLVLLGKTGQGKSSTGNSILMEERFKVSGSPGSVTWKNNLEEKIIDGRTLTVADTPGFYDTRLDEKNVKDHALSFLNDVMVLQREGFHALLYVYKYGERMTEDHKKSVLLLKTTLGNEVIKNHVVCIITAGDVFEKENDSFDSWCHDTGSKELDELFKECQYRCVLFNNETDDTDVKKYQLIRLVSMVETIPSRYTNEDFKTTNTQIEEILSEAMSPEQKQNIENYLRMLIAHVKKGEMLDEKMLKSLDEHVQTAKNLAKDIKINIRNYINEIKSYHEKNKIVKTEDKRRKEMQERIDNYLIYVNTELEMGEELGKETLQKLESYKTESSNMLSKNNFTEIEHRIRIMKDKSDEIRQKKMMTNKKQEINEFLSHVEKELNNGNRLDKVTLQKLEDYKKGEFEMLPENDFKEIELKIKDLMERSDKEMKKENKKDETRTEINKFLDICEKILKDGHELKYLEIFKLGKYEKDAEQDLTKDDYRKIQKKIKKLMTESEKRHNNTVTKQKKKAEANIMKKIDDFIEEYKKHVAEQKILSEEETKKLIYFEMFAKEKLNWIERMKIIRKINDLKCALEKIGQNEKKKEIMMEQKNTEEKLETLNVKIKNNKKIEEYDFESLTQSEQSIKQYFSRTSEQDVLLKKIETLRKLSKDNSDKARDDIENILNERIWSPSSSFFKSLKKRNFEKIASNTSNLSA